MATNEQIINEINALIEHPPQVQGKLALYTLDKLAKDGRLDDTRYLLYLRTLIYTWGSEKKQQEIIKIPNLCRFIGKFGNEHPEMIVFAKMCYSTYMKFVASHWKHDIIKSEWAVWCRDAILDQWKTYLEQYRGFVLVAMDRHWSVHGSSNGFDRNAYRGRKELEFLYARAQHSFRVYDLFVEPLTT